MESFATNTPVKQKKQLEELIQVTQGSELMKSKGHQRNQTWLAKGNEAEDLAA